MLVFHSRPFSNTFESVLLALTLALPGTLPLTAKSLPSSPRAFDSAVRRRALAFGVLVALGAFTRITYPGFAAPLGVYFLVAADYQRRKLATHGASHAYFVRIFFIPFFLHTF